MRPWSVLILFAAGCAAAPHAATQPDPAPIAAITPAADPRPEATAESAVVEVPFRYASGKIFLDVKVNGHGPYPFALDTGSPPTVVDSTLARSLGIRVTDLGQVGGAGDGETAMGGADAVSLEFGGITLPPRPMMTIEINQRLSDFNGGALMGLIGNDFVASRIVEIDYPHSVLRIRSAKGWEYHGSGTVLRTRRRGHTFVNGTVELRDGEEIPARLLVDTGAGLAMSLNTAYVNRNRLLEKCKPPFTATVGYGLGGEVRHAVCRLDALKLGDLTVDRPVCTLSQDKGGALASPDWDGLIGGELLSRFTVIFDGPGRRMILEPGPRADDPIETDMSGIALRGSTGELSVYRIVKGSPADDAGLEEGDVILSVDGRDVTGADRDAVRLRFRTDGAVRTLRIRRGDQEQTIRLTLKRMVMRGSQFPQANSVALLIA